MQSRYFRLFFGDPLPPTTVDVMYGSPISSTASKINQVWIVWNGSWEEATRRDEDFTSRANEPLCSLDALARHVNHVVAKMGQSTKRRLMHGYCFCISQRVQLKLVVRIHSRKIVTLHHINDTCIWTEFHKIVNRTQIDGV